MYVCCRMFGMKLEVLYTSMLALSAFLFAPLKIFCSLQVASANSLKCGMYSVVGAYSKCVIVVRHDLMIIVEPEQNCPLELLALG